MALTQDIDDVLDPLLGAFQTRLAGILTNHAVTGYHRGAAQRIQYGRTLTTDRPIYFEGPPIQQAIAWAGKRAAKMVTEIDQETRDVLRGIITDGIKEKRGIDGLARDIRRQFRDWERSEEMPVYRSRLIARTETATALSQGSFERGKDMGVKYKSWLTRGDDKVRPAHLENEAAGVIPWDEPFPDGSLAPPGADPFNCRCTLVPRLAPADAEAGGD